MDVFGAGEIFGEMALLGAQARTATARAIERTEVINISRAHLLNLLRNGDPILRHLVLSLVNRLKRTNAKIRPDKTDNVYLSVCGILALLANQKPPLTDETGNLLLSYAMTIEQFRGILSIDATDCRSILEKLEAFNFIEIVYHQTSRERMIRLIDAETFLQKVQRASEELESAFRLDQRSVYMDLFDFSEHIGIEREKIYKKIAEGEFPEELVLFKKDAILKWLEEVGPSFFEEKKKRISAEDLNSLDDIVHVRSTILRAVLGKMDFYKICQLLKAANAPVVEKILSNLSGRLKQIVEQELELIEEVDPDEVEQVTEDLLEEIQELMEADKKRKGSEEQAEDTDDAQ